MVNFVSPAADIGIVALFGEDFRQSVGDEVPEIGSSVCADAVEGIPIEIDAHGTPCDGNR